LIFLLSSCKKELLTSHYSEKKKLKIEEFDFEYLQVKSKVKYDDGLQNFKANANIRIRNDSAIWISISSTGVEIMRALIQKDSIFVIDRMKKKYSEFTFDSLRTAYNIDFDYDMLEAVLVGNLIKSRKNNDKVIKDNEFFILKQNNRNFVIDNYVNSKTMKIEKVNIVEEPSSSSLEIRYEDFQFSNEKLFPFKNSIFLTYNKGNSELKSYFDVSYSRVDVDDKKMKLPFNIPNRYVPKE
jgi:hypothetical protein